MGPPKVRNCRLTIPRGYQESQDWPPPLPDQLVIGGGHFGFVSYPQASQTSSEPFPKIVSGRSLSTYLE